MKPSFYQYPLHELGQLFQAHNLPESGAGKLFNWHYKQRMITPCTKNLAQVSIDFLKENLDFDLPQIDQIQHADDKTVKFLFKLHDDMKVETVLIPFQNKYAICLSSQVGCAMKCAFCFTGTQGLKRNLQTQEIVGQLVVAQRWLTENRPEEDRILNVVFMGQGEPLHNFDAVKAACQIFLSQHGLSLAKHKITISTSGYLPGLLRWKEEMPDVNIALSLHSPFTEKRNQLIPINRAYPLQQVLELVKTFPTEKKRFVTYEYLLIKDFNDNIEDAHATGELLKDHPALVNLIPFNPFPGSEFQRPEMDKVLAFKEVIESYQIPTMIRTTKGESILAACGQLNTALT